MKFLQAVNTTAIIAPCLVMLSPRVLDLPSATGVGIQSTLQL